MRVKAKVVGHRKIREEDYVLLDHESVREQDYSGRRLRQFCTIGSRLEKCNFAGIRINDAAFGAGREVSEFVECNFDDARMEHMSGGPSRYVRCSFRNLELSRWFAHEVELIDCLFTGCLRGSVFNGRVLEDMRHYLGREVNEIRGNDFSAMEFVDVGFRKGVDLSQQHLPSGPDYLYLPDAPSAVARARAALLNWSKLELRQAAFQSLKSLEYEISTGQQQLLLRKSDEYLYVSPPREAIETLYSLLRGEHVTLD